MLTKINSGGFGTVFRIDSSEEPLALKIVAHKRGSIQNILEIILYFTLCSHLIQAVEYSLNRKCYKILMPLAKYDFCKLLKQPLIRNFEIRENLYNICLGIEYLHSRNIVHGDIKPSNILVFKCNKKYNLKITDFSISGLCHDRIYNKNAYTLGYKAPELETLGNYSFKADIWALGQIFKQCRNKFLELQINSFDDLINKMLHHQETERYDIYQILNSPFFFGVNNFVEVKPQSTVNVVKNLNNDLFIDSLISKMTRQQINEDEEFLDKEITYLTPLITFFQKNIF
jgi:serine/threonine protein kinase